MKLINLISVTIISLSITACGGGTDDTIITTTTNTTEVTNNNTTTVMPRPVSVAVVVPEKTPTSPSPVIVIEKPIQPTPIKEHHDNGNHYGQNKNRH